jgi:hypothetical protein
MVKKRGQPGTPQKNPGKITSPSRNQLNKHLFTGATAMDEDVMDDATLRQQRLDKRSAVTKEKPNKNEKKKLSGKKKRRRGRSS